MNKKLIFSLVGIVVIFIIAVASYFWNPGDFQKDTTSGVNSQDSAIVEPTQNESEILKDFDKDKAPTFEDTLKSKAPELERVDKDKVSEGIEGFSKEEINDAGKFVSDYIYETHSNTYFLGGEWGRNGNDISQLKGVLGRYYSKDIVDKLDKYEKDKENQEFAEKVTGMIPYFDESSTYSPSEYCATSGTSENPKPIEDGEATIVEGFNDCPINLKISEIDYESVSKNGINKLNVYFNTEATYPLFSKELNTDAQTTATYKYGMELTPKFADESDINWEITGYNANVSFSKIEKMKGK